MTTSKLVRMINCTQKVLVISTVVNAMNVFQMGTRRTSQKRNSKQNYEQLVEEHKWKDLRQERNKRLAEVDWVFSEDYSIDDDSYQQWLTYRKALRDLPSLTEDPENPVWPEQPAMPSGTTENKDLTRELRIENNRLKSKVTILENRQTHFNTLLVNLIGRIETLERPT